MFQLKVRSYGICPSLSRQFLLKSPHTNLLRLTPSELQHWSVLHQGKSGEGGIFLPGRSAGRGHCCFDEPTLHRDGKQAPCLSLHQPGLHCLPSPVVLPWDLFPPNMQAPPSCFQFLYRVNVLSWLMLQTFLNSLKQAASGVSEPRYLSLSGPRPGTSSSWLCFTGV